MAAEVIGAFMTSAAYSLVMQVPKETIMQASINGALAWFIHLLFLDSCGLAFSTYAAGICMAMGTQYLSKKYKTPSTVILIPSFIPFVPGGDIYKCMFYLMKGQSTYSIYHLGLAITVAGMLVLGSLSAEAVRRVLKRIIGK